MSRGRPRKPGARKPSGDLKFVPDKGTTELRAHRQAATGTDPEDRRAAYQLGILLARGQLTRQQHYAGTRYHGLFVRAVRGVGVPSVLGALMGGGQRGSTPANIEQSIVMAGKFAQVVATPAEEVRAAYLAAREVLECAGWKPTRAVDAVAVYDVAPVAWSMRWLHAGLDALWGHFESVGATTVRQAIETAPRTLIETPDITPDDYGQQFRRATWAK